MSSEDQTPETAKTHRPKRLLRSPKMWLITGVAVVTLVAIGVGSFFLFSPRRSNAAAGRTTTATAALGTQTATVSMEGTLSPSKQANLNFSVSGEVTSVKVKSGQKVTKGQKLATIDSSSLADAVDLAEANLTSAEANYSDVSDSGTSAAIKAAAAQVDSAEASLASAKVDLKSATLRASMSGTVASVDIAVGDQVSGSGSAGSSGSGAGQDSSGTSTTTTSSSSAQVVVIATSKWKIEGTVGASDLSSLKAGQAATVSADSTEYTGKVASVGIVATSTSDGAATFPVVINLSGTHKGLYSGTTASATITTGSYTNVLTIPTAAITTTNAKTVVTKVDSSGTTTLTEVEIGRVFGDATEITGGLAEGDTVQITTRASSSKTNSTSDSQGSGGLGGLGGLGGDTGGGGAPPAGGGGAAGGPNR